MIDHNDYKRWDFFNSSIQNICENQKFQGVELLVAGDRDRVTPNIATIKTTSVLWWEVTIQNMQLKWRFEPWPQWLTNCNNAFNFQNGLVIQERKVSFDNLMDCKCGPNPLLSEERKRLASEFITLCLNAEQITTKLKAQNPNNPIFHKDVWYELLTNENMYKNC